MLISKKGVSIRFIEHTLNEAEKAINDANKKCGGDGWIDYMDPIVSLVSSVESLTNAMNAHGHRWELYFLRGEIYLMQGKFPSVLKDFEHALELLGKQQTALGKKEYDRIHYDIILYLLKVCHILKDWKRLLFYVDQLMLTKKDDDGHLCLTKGLAFMGMGKNKEAKQMFRKTIRLGWDNNVLCASGCENLGKVYMLLKHWRSGVKAMQSTIKLSTSQSWKVHYKLGFCYYNISKYPTRMAAAYLNAADLMTSEDWERGGKCALAIMIDHLKEADSDAKKSLDKVQKKFLKVTSFMKQSEEDFH